MDILFPLVVASEVYQFLDYESLVLVVRATRSIRQVYEPVALQMVKHLAKVAAGRVGAMRVRLRHTSLGLGIVPGNDFATTKFWTSKKQYVVCNLESLAMFPFSPPNKCHHRSNIMKVTSLSMTAIHHNKGDDWDHPG